MSISLKHSKTSTVPDSGDTSLVQPSDWNSEHALTCATNKVLGRVSSGTGTVEEIDFTDLVTLTGAQAKITATGLLKGAGAGAISSATAGTDYVSPSVLGAANGVATLGADSKLTSSQIPDIAVVDYLGSVASQSAMLALTGQKGDWCTRSDLGTNWIITGTNPAVIGSWTQLSYPTAPVTSVNGQTGAVSLSAANVGAQPTVTVNGIVKGNGSGTLSAAVSGTDYAPATSGSSILAGNGSGGFSNVTISTGLSYSGGSLSSSCISSITSANGFSGLVSGGALTLAISGVSGMVKSTGSALASATAGTDYVAPSGALGTPSSGTLTNCTGLPVSTGVSGLGSGVATFLATPSSANLATAVTDETGSGSLVFGTSPTITTGTYTGLRETKTAPTISAGTLTLNCSSGNVFAVALNANITTLSFSNVPTTGTAYALTLSFTADGTARTVTWGASVKWPSGTAPTLTSTNTKVDTFVLTTWDAGTTWYAFTAGQNA